MGNCTLLKQQLIGVNEMNYYTLKAEYLSNQEKQKQQFLYDLFKFDRSYKNGLLVVPLSKVRSYLSGKDFTKLNTFSIKQAVNVQGKCYVRWDWFVVNARIKFPIAA
jgi:hypothetical protein